MSVRAALCAFVRAPLPLRAGAAGGGCLLAPRLGSPPTAATAHVAAAAASAATPSASSAAPLPPSRSVRHPSTKSNEESLTSSTDSTSSSSTSCSSSSTTPSDALAPEANGTSRPLTGAVEVLASAGVAVAVAEAPAPGGNDCDNASIGNIGKREPIGGTGLRWRCGAVCIPHPDKADKGGEDAYFVVPNALGVFDGVGGWASVGVDPGLYSKQLARLTAANIPDGDVRKALETATATNEAIGSSTACVLALRERRLTSLNLGDSGFVIVREGRLLAKTSEQQHYFNCPFQLGTDSMDTVAMASKLDLILEHGDWVIVATDGLWDNVFPTDVLEIVNEHHARAVDIERVRESESENEKSMDEMQVEDKMEIDSNVATLVDANPQLLAQKLAELAQRVAMDERVASPFAVNAQQAGHLFLGGKMDDITVVAALVVDPALEGVEAPDQQLSNTSLKLGVEP